jgi:hypothetical protein
MILIQHLVQKRLCLRLVVMRLKMATRSITGRAISKKTSRSIMAMLIQMQEELPRMISIEACVPRRSAYPASVRVRPSNLNFGPKVSFNYLQEEFEVDP